MKKVSAVLFFLFIYKLLGAQPLITDIQPQGGGLTKANACIGETIRLVGIGFQTTGTTMTVNGGPVVSVYTFINSNTIEFQIPAGSPITGLGVVATVSGLSSIPRVLAINPTLSILSQPIQQNVCEGGTFTFSLNAVGGVLNYLWRKNGVSTGITTNTISGIASLADSGVVYTTDILDVACGMSIASNPTKLIVNSLPNNPTTLPNLDQCQDGNFTLNAPSPTKGTGTWSCVSNCVGIGFANQNIPNTVASGVPVSTASQLRWTVVNGACSASSDLMVTNYGMPTSIASISNTADTSICSTSATLFLFGNYPSGTYTNVGWSLQGPSTGTFSNPTINYTTFTPTSGEGVYKINYSIKNGACSSTSPDKKIIVYNPATAYAGVDFVKCFGVTVNSSGTVSNASSFNWSTSGANGNLSNATSLNPSYTSAGADSVGVTVALILSASNPGCGIVGDTANITIHAKPHAKIPTGFTAPVCEGSSVSIPVNFTGTSPFIGIGIFDGTTTTSLGTISGTSTNAILNPTSNSNYTLVPVGSFKDGNDCIGSWEGSRSVAVLAKPSATINIIPSTLCAGDTATLLINPSGGATSWNVYGNNGGANTMTSISGVYSTLIFPTTNETYTIDSIETAACGKIDLSGISKSIVVNTPPVVSASMGITVSDDTLCKGEETTISISGLQANTIYKLIKVFNAISLDSIEVGNTSPGVMDFTIPFSKFSPGGIDTIRFVARKHGCSNRVSSVTKAYIWVSGLTNPVITAATGTMACERKILQGNNQPSISYQWYQGTSPLIGSVSYKDTAYFNGSYLLKVKDTLSCKLASNTIVVDYHTQTPVISGTDISASETKLSTSALADRYFWYAESGSGVKKIVGATAKELSVYFDGNYYLGTITNNCFFMSEPLNISGKTGGSLLRQSFIETDSTIILPGLDFNHQVKLYPNPAFNSDITIDYIGQNATKVAFFLYNSQGIPVLQKEIEANGSAEVIIPTKQLPSGLYNLLIQDGPKQVRENIMIY